MLYRFRARQNYPFQRWDGTLECTLFARHLYQSIGKGSIRWGLVFECLGVGSTLKD